MFYNFDVRKFVMQMLPTILRQNVLKAFLNALIEPVRDLYMRFRYFMQQCIFRLRCSGQVIALKQALILRYNLDDEDIKIIDAENTQVYLHCYDDKHTRVYLNEESTFISYNSEGRHTADYTILVPDFLKEYESEIAQLCNAYKPAGRTYKLSFYSYD